MALDMAFDPITGDILDGDDGGPVETETAATAVHLQLESHLDEWWGDPDAGSLLHDTARFQAAPEALLPDEAKRALGLLVEAGLIADVSSRAEAAKYGRVHVLTRFRDLSTGAVVDTVVRAGG